MHIMTKPLAHQLHISVYVLFFPQESLLFPIPPRQAFFFLKIEPFAPLSIRGLYNPGVLLV